MLFRRFRQQVKVLCAQQEKLSEAVRYCLNRIQTDPDLAYHMIGTQAMALLMEAEALCTDDELEAVRARRTVDLQPAHSKRVARLVAYREWAETVCRIMDERRIEYPEPP